MQGQDRTLRTAVPGKGPNHSGDRIPTSLCGHQALYPSHGGQHMDALFTGQIPTKVIIGLLTNEAFDGVWQKNPFNFTHMDLHSVSRDVDGRPLLAQPWQPYFMIAPSEQLCLEKVLTTLGTEYPLANVVTKHFTLATEAST